MIYILPFVQVTAKQMEIARRSAKADRKFLDCLLTNIFRLFRQKAGAIDPRRLTDETFYVGEE